MREHFFFLIGSDLLSAGLSTKHYLHYLYSVELIKTEKPSYVQVTRPHQPAAHPLMLFFEFNKIQIKVKDSNALMRILGESRNSLLNTFIRKLAVNVFSFFKFSGKIRRSELQKTEKSESVRKGPIGASLLNLPIQSEGYLRSLKQPELIDRV